MEIESESSSDSESGHKTKIGDRLFDGMDEAPKSVIMSLRENVKEMDIATMREMIEKEIPELNPMLSELKQSMEDISHLKVTLSQLRQLRKECPKNCLKFLEMKYNLTLSYSSFLLFYLLMKIEDKSTANHQMLYKLAHIKTLFDKLAPLNDKIKKAVEAIIKTDTSQTDEAEMEDVDEGDLEDIEEFSNPSMGLEEDYGQEELSPSKLREI